MKLAIHLLVNFTMVILSASSYAAPNKASKCGRHLDTADAQTKLVSTEEDLAKLEYFLANAVNRIITLQRGEKILDLELESPSMPALIKIQKSLASRKSRLAIQTRLLDVLEGYYVHGQLQDLRLDWIVVPIYLFKGETKPDENILRDLLMAPGGKELVADFLEKDLTAILYNGATMSGKNYSLHGLCVGAACGLFAGGIGGATLGAALGSVLGTQVTSTTYYKDIGRDIRREFLKEN